MLRRVLVSRAVLGPVLAWALCLAALPRGVDGAPLPPAAAGTAPADPAVLEARLITQRLVALGVSPGDAAARLAALRDVERHELATRLDELGAGGSAAAVLGAAFVVAILVILVLELMGRRVVSRP